MGALLDHAYQRNCIIYPLKCNQCVHFMLLYPTWWWVSYEYIQWSVIIMGCSRCVEPGRQTWSCHFLPPGWFSCLSGSPQPKQAAFPSWWQNESFHWTSHEQPWEFSGKTMYQHLQYHPHTLLNLCSFPILVPPFFQNNAESPDFHGTNQFYPWEKVHGPCPKALWLATFKSATLLVFDMESCTVLPLGKLTVTDTMDTMAFFKFWWTGGRIWETQTPRTWQGLPNMS